MQYNHWKTDLNDSAKALLNIQHTVLPKLIKGKIHSVENSNNDILMLIDRHAGIDYIRENKKGLQGIAARVQFGNKAWNSFTVRFQRHSGTKTEYEKRVEAIKEGYFFPAFTLQAYFKSRDDLTLKSIAIIKTIDLYNFIQKYPDQTIKRESDNIFIVVYWDVLRQFRQQIKIFIGD